MILRVILYHHFKIGNDLPFCVCVCNMVDDYTFWKYIGILTYYLASLSKGVKIKNLLKKIRIGQWRKLAVARAPPLFLPRPEIIYIYVLHFSAPPWTNLVRAPPPLSPDRRYISLNFCQKLFRFEQFLYLKLPFLPFHFAFFK